MDQLVQVKVYRCPGQYLLVSLLPEVTLQEGVLWRGVKMAPEPKVPVQVWSEGMQKRMGVESVKPMSKFGHLFMNMFSPSRTSMNACPVRTWRSGREEDEAT